MIQAVIFDLDGLLVETETICYQILKEILARFGRPFALEEYTRSFSGKPETVNAAHLVEAYKLPSRRRRRWSASSAGKRSSTPRGFR